MKTYIKLNVKPSIVWVNEVEVNNRIDADYYHMNHMDCAEVNESLLKISEVCNISNNRFNPKQYNKETLKYIDISNVDIFTGEFAYEEYDKQKAPSRARKKVNEGDIILSTVRPKRNAVSIINLEDDELVVSTGFAVIKCKELVDNYYIFAALKAKSSIEQLVRRTSGGMYPAISEKDIMDIEISIPSHEIQKYIGDKVRKAEDLRGKAKKLEYELKDIINELISIEISKTIIWNLNPIFISDRLDCEYNYKYFYELEEKFIKSGLNVVEFGSLIEKKMSEPQTDSSDFVENGIPVLRITDIQEDSLNFDSCARISEEIYEKLKAFQLIPDDIIFGLSGTVGRAIVVPKEIPDKVITNRRVAKVTLKDPKLAHYIVSFLNSECGVAQMLRESTGGVQKNLRLEDITKIKIPLPDNEYIQMIATKAEEKVKLLNMSKQLIREAKKDVEDLIEGNFDMSKLNQS